jgi:hypothetical protein
METRYIKRLFSACEGIELNDCSSFLIIVILSSHIVDKEKTLESLRLKRPYYLRRCGHNTERCIKIIDGLIQQYVEKYSEECNQENLLLIRGLWMLRQHPRLFVRRGQWAILLSIAQNLSDVV